jgi:hypothetical protein
MHIHDVKHHTTKGALSQSPGLPAAHPNVSTAFWQEKSEVRLLLGAAIPTIIRAHNGYSCWGNRLALTYCLQILSKYVAVGRADCPRLFVCLAAAASGLHTLNFIPLRASMSRKETCPHATCKQHRWFSILRSSKLAFCVTRRGAAQRPQRGELRCRMSNL